MDYVVGSVAALISGNVTPSRPKLVKRALTPTKHPQSPNVTPKSEFIDDRSIFLSPSVQKKKAIVKKSPKRIFQNPDSDTTLNEGNNSLTSPVVDKVKKHLNEQLDTENTQTVNMAKAKSPKNKLNKSKESMTPVKESVEIVDVQKSNENTPKKKKRKSTPSEPAVDSKQNTENVTETINEEVSNKTSPTKRKRSKSTNEQTDEKENLKSTENNDTVNEVENKSDNTYRTNKKKKRKNKKKKPNTNQEEIQINKSEETKPDTENNDASTNKLKSKKKSKKTKQEDTNQEEEMIVNPNAITSQETDSEHESDDDIQSEDENKEALEAAQEESSDEEEEETSNKKEKQKAKTDEPKEQHIATEDEIKRTLFVGNVPFSKKCKKEVKKLFSQYGDIETVRIRTVPVKDATVTPKLAVIKNELHPERTTVNVYIKYKHADSIDQALSANNTVMNEHHLRVTRSDTSGSAHDPKCSVFVGNIPFGLEDEALRAKFQGCGEIESVRIVRDRKTNAGKGFGYVNFASKDGVELALALTEEDLTIKNRIMRVKRCTQNANSGKKGFNTRGNGQNGPNMRGNGQNMRGNGPNMRGNGPNMRGNGRYMRGGGRGGSFGRGNAHNARGNGPNGPGNGRGNWSNSRGNDGNMSNPRKFDNNVSNGEETGAFRRIMNKRKFQEGGEGPPNREKKPRKEFVGLTGEKKKKQKFNKGQKKKKALSEILTK
ncbi:unnamed protein product [Colias eurytheme]|nr:unnamed protein product [Colias eurytheme]